MAVPAITAYVKSSEFNAGFAASKAFDLTTTAWITASTATGFVGAQYASAWVARAYYVTHNLNEPNRAPQAWTFEGSNDGSSWTTLDTRTSQTSWVNPRQTRYFSFANSTAYSFYRINVSANNGDGFLAIAELVISDVVVSAGAAAYPAEVIADSPAFYARFSETAGAIAEDASGNHCAPVWLSGTYTRGTTGLLADSDKAVTLATNGWGRVNTWPQGASFTGPLTVEAVIKLSSLPTYSTIVQFDDGAMRNFIFRVDNNGSLALVWWTTAGVGPNFLNSAASAIAVGTQYHVAATHTGSTVTLYINGTSVATSSVANGVRSGGVDYLAIGGDSVAGFYFNGILDEVAIYPTALSSTRIAAHSAAVSTAPAGDITGTIAGTSPVGVGSVTGTVPTTGTLAGTSPSGTGALVGTAPTTGTVAGTSPSGVGSLAGDVPSFEVTGTIAGTSPSGTGALVGTVPVVGTVAGTSPSGIGALVGDVIVPTTGDLAGTSPSGVGSMAGSVIVPEPGVLYLSAPSRHRASLTSFEVYTPAPEVLFLSARSVHGAALRIHPVPVPVPGWISDHPLQAQRHLMTPKTEAQPRKMGDPLRARADGSDGYVYPVEVSDVGRYRVFASGIDITYLAGTPTTLHEWSFAKFFGPLSASFTVPLPEWAEPGQGAYRLFWGDAPIEIALEDAEGNLLHLWEGFTGEESDTAAPGQTGVTWNCEGTFQQAAHWLCDPPAVRTERDAGHVIADLLNSVPNHRYNKIRRFTTGHLVSDGGDSAQSVLARVAEIIGETFDDDSNQLGLQRRGPYAYELDWNQPVTVPDWTFTKGSPGFTSTLIRPHNARRDMVFGRGIAPDGGFWMNRHFPGLASSTPPVYPIAGFGSMSVGTTDADTVGGQGVTTWQRRMRFLGYPVTVDGVMNSNDTQWVREIQRKRGITDDGSLGPQTWSATWEGGNQTPETTTIRLPLTFKENSFADLYDASGAVVGKNPLFDGRRILHATPEVDFGTNIRKSNGRGLAGKIRVREASPGYVGTLTAEGVDPHEVGSSRLFVNDGANILVDGHHGGTVVQVSAVTHTPTLSRWTVDSGARGQALVDAIMDRQRDVRRSLAGKSTKVTDRGTLNASQLGQYESESPAGKYSRTAINGDSGLWTVRCIYVAEQGLARFRLTSSPNAEIITAIWDRPVTANYIASKVPDPIADGSGWYAHAKEMKARGLIQVAGTPENPGGYWPEQKGTGPLTGEQAAGNISMKSQRGGFFWIGTFTSRSTFVEGEFEPEVSTA